MPASTGQHAKGAGEREAARAGVAGLSTQRETRNEVRPHARRHYEGEPRHVGPLGNQAGRRRLGRGANPAQVKGLDDPANGLENVGVLCESAGSEEAD